MKLLLPVFILLLNLPVLPANSGTNPLITWDLTELFHDESKWKESLNKIEKDLASVKICQGKLGNSSGQLLKCLTAMYDLRKQTGRAYVWASLQLSTDLKNTKFNEYNEVMKNLSAKVSETMSFVRPELIKIGEKKIKSLTNGKKEFAPYSVFLQDVIREAKHTLGAKEEALMAAFSPVLGDSSSTRELLYTADMTWEKVKLANGETVTVDDNGYSKHRASTNRNDRIKVFASFYTSLKQFERTLGSILSRELQTHVIDAKQRKYKTALERSLSANNVPESVYRSLVAEVNTGLPTLHRYLKLRGQILGIKDLAYHDNYPELAKNGKKYTLEESRNLLLAGIAPLGEDYLKKTAFATSQKWTDAYPREGKSGGAYMSGEAYDVHPYIFLNHEDDFDSAMTYAHEWGHGVHTLLANEAQPYTKADYPIFTAEVASTLNEALVIKHILSKTTDPKERLFFLGHELEFIRTTFYRQTQLAEYELALHEELEKGEPLTGEKMSQIYGQILKRYYGADKGVMAVDDKYSLEWAFIPHFYYNFYVYQYATSVSAGYYFADKIVKNEPGIVQKYLGVLKGGGSKYPYELLKDAGLDMAKPEAYQAIIRRADEIMDEMELLLKKK